MGVYDKKNKKWPTLDREVNGLSGHGAWGSPIYLNDVKRVEAKGGFTTKGFYFRVKEVRAEYRNAGHIDRVPWTDDLKGRHAAWDEPFTIASQNSPKESDEAIVGGDIT